MEVRGGLSKQTADLLKHCDFRDLRSAWNNQVERPGILCEPLQNCCDCSSSPQLHHQPRMLLRDGGRSPVWLLSRATTSSFGHITAPTHTFVIIHGYLCMMGRTGTAVLCTCNSTSSQSPQEGSRQEEFCQQAGQIGLVEANRGTSEKK